VRPRYVFVGDPHGEAGDLDDLKALLARVKQVCHEVQAPPWFLGDQYDTHAIVHAEVMKVWYDFLREMSDPFGERTVMLKGNHDGPANGTTGATALLTHVDQCVVVTEPRMIGPLLALPYIKDPAEFVGACRKYGQAHTVVCHQEFDGSHYETGYPALGGAKPTDVPQELIVSGHIHTPASFGKVRHLGAPRWRVELDAKVEERFLWLMEFDEEGRLASEKPFETGPYVRRIRRFVDTPAKPAPLGPWPPKDDVRVDVRGPREYVADRAPLHEAAGCLVRRLPDAEVRMSVKESDGVPVAWAAWVDSFKPPRGTPIGTLKKMLAERADAA
jgi:Calcineurin-like phosphoesterase